MGTGEPGISPGLLVDACLSSRGTARHAHYLTAFQLANTINLCSGSYKAPVLKTSKPEIGNLKVDSTTIIKSILVSNTR